MGKTTPKGTGGGGLTPRGPPGGLDKTRSQMAARVPHLKGLAIEERASEELVEHAEVELEFDSGPPSDSVGPKSARTKAAARAGTLEEHTTNDLSTISPVLKPEEESSRLNNNESIISSLNMGDESTNNPNKASFLSGEDTDGPGQTPDFANEKDPSRTISRLGTEEPGELNAGILVHSLQTLFEEISRREKIENRIFIIKCALF